MLSEATKSLTSGVIEDLLKTLPGKLKGVLEEVGNLIFSKKNRRKDAELDRSDGKTRQLADEQRKPKDKVDEKSNEESDSDRKTDPLDNNDQERNDQEDRKSNEEADETSSPDDQPNEAGDSGKSKSTEDSSDGNDRETHTDGDGTDADVDPDAPNSVPGHPTFKPGPHANGSIPATSSAQTFIPAERAAVDAIGYKTGCHTCGTRTPGTKSGHFVPDHQPPTKLNDANLPQELFPHCIDCSREQGLAIARKLRKQ